jgi:hypothetical protein
LGGIGPLKPRDLPGRFPKGWLGALFWALITTTVVVAAGAFALWQQPLTVDQRIVGMAAVFTGGAFLLAAAAAVIAIQAYRAATNHPVLAVWGNASQDGETIIFSFDVRNFGSASARNVTLAVYFEGFAAILAQGWDGQAPYWTWHARDVAIT